MYIFIIFKSEEKFKIDRLKIFKFANQFLTNNKLFIIFICFINFCSIFLERIEICKRHLA